VLTERLEFTPERDAEAFAAAPAAPAVFLLRGADERAEPYVSKTANLRRRLQRLLGPVEERTKKLNLRDRVRGIEYAPTGSDFESGFLLYSVLRAAFPKTYSDRMRFRFAPLVKLHLENEYPRASITTRLGRLGGRSLYYGPFISRVAAEKFMNDSLDFFKMRRCVDDLHPDPKFPGCIYSEMKMCLAPCFKGCSDEEYVVEVNRVQAYFDSAGDSLARELSARPALGADDSGESHCGVGDFFSSRLRADLGADSVWHSVRGARQVAVDGIAGAAGFRFSGGESKIRAGKHGAPCSAQALVLPRQPHGRNFLR
jgi:excinuclease ABC subunit C